MCHFVFRISENNIAKLCLVNILQKKRTKQEENEEIPWCKITNAELLLKKNHISQKWKLIRENLKKKQNLETHNISYI